MDIKDFAKYIEGHATGKIMVGKSGADVYELERMYIAKYIRRDSTPSEAAWEAYRREAQFYSSCTSDRFPFLPKVHYCRRNEEEIQIIMEKYCPLNRNDLNDAMFEKIFDALNCIHSMPVPEFLSETDAGALQLEADEINRCLSGWRDVIKEHGDDFEERELVKIGEHINRINRQAHIPGKMCCHGDFHLDNLLRDDKGNIIVCDWQNVHAGHGSGDISFFLSRLSADGVEITREKAIRMYCRRSNAGVTEKEISVQMSLANMNVSFIHWHNYLRGSSSASVRPIWESMTEDAESLYRACGL